MVSSASVQFSLLACLFIAVSFAANPRRGNRVQKPGKKAPQCLYSDYVYSPTLRKCIQTGTKVQCGANMYFMSTGASGKGRCVCRNEIDKPCLGRPQIRSAAKDRCWNLGERVSLNLAIIVYVNVSAMNLMVLLACRVHALRTRC